MASASATPATAATATAAGTAAAAATATAAAPRRPSDDFFASPPPARKRAQARGLSMRSPEPTALADALTAAESAAALAGGDTSNSVAASIAAILESETDEIPPPPPPRNLSQISLPDPNAPPAPAASTLASAAAMATISEAPTTAAAPPRQHSSPVVGTSTTGVTPASPTPVRATSTVGTAPQPQRAVSTVATSPVDGRALSPPPASILAAVDAKSPANGESNTSDFNAEVTARYLAKLTAVQIAMSELRHEMQTVSADRRRRVLAGYERDTKSAPPAAGTATGTVVMAMSTLAGAAGIDANTMYDTAGGGGAGGADGMSTGSMIDDVSLESEWEMRQQIELLTERYFTRSHALFGHRMPPPVPHHWRVLYCVEKVYWPVVQACLTPNFPALNAIARKLPATEYDRVARALVAVCELCGTTLPMIVSLLSREVSTTSSEGTLFRVNSLSSKVMGFFIRHIANEYLVHTLRPVCTAIVRKVVPVPIALLSDAPAAGAAGLTVSAPPNPAVAPAAAAAASTNSSANAQAATAAALAAISQTQLILMTTNTAHVHVAVATAAATTGTASNPAAPSADSLLSGSSAPATTTADGPVSLVPVDFEVNPQKIITEMARPNSPPPQSALPSGAFPKKSTAGGGGGGAGRKSITQHAPGPSGDSSPPPKTGNSAATPIGNAANNNKARHKPPHGTAAPASTNPASGHLSAPNGKAPLISPHYATYRRAPAGQPVATPTTPTATTTTAPTIAAPQPIKPIPIDASGGGGGGGFLSVAAPAQHSALTAPKPNGATIASRSTSAGTATGSQSRKPPVRTVTQNVLTLGASTADTSLEAPIKQPLPAPAPAPAPVALAKPQSANAIDELNADSALSPSSKSRQLSSHRRKPALNDATPDLASLATGEVTSDATAAKDDPSAPAASETQMARVRLNQRELERAVDAVLDAVIGSLERAPKRLRLLAHSLQRTVTRKFPGPNARHSAVSGMLFLRFICPAFLTTPEWLFDDGTGVNSLSRRNFILLTKVLQNMANGVFFGAKERFMVPLNACIARNTARVVQFCHEFANPPYLFDPDHSEYPFRATDTAADGDAAAAGASGFDMSESTAAGSGSGAASGMAASGERADLVTINHMAKEVKSDCALLLTLVRKYEEERKWEIAHQRAIQEAARRAAITAAANAKAKADAAAAAAAAAASLSGTPASNGKSPKAFALLGLIESKPNSGSATAASPAPVIGGSGSLFTKPASSIAAALAAGPLTWQRDEDVKSCPTCKVSFSIVKRRHHCRQCGAIFCDACSAKTCPLLHLGLKGEQRVCNDCHTKLKRYPPPIPTGAAAVSKGSLRANEMNASARQLLMRQSSVL